MNDAASDCNEAAYSRKVYRSAVASEERPYGLINDFLLPSFHLSMSSFMEHSTTIMNHSALAVRKGLLK